jgi:hypothetical protein
MSLFNRHSGESRNPAENRYRVADKTGCLQRVSRNGQSLMLFRSAETD